MKKLVDGQLVDLTPAEIAEITAPRPLADLKAKRLSALAAIRWEHETGGVTVNGADIQTDRDSQALINGAYALANRNVADPDFTIDFKGAGGWVSLTASQMIAIADAVGQHVQACFKRERALSALIEAATDAAGLEAVNINAGWP